MNKIRHLLLAISCLSTCLATDHCLDLFNLQTSKSSTSTDIMSIEFGFYAKDSHEMFAKLFYVKRLQVNEYLKSRRGIADIARAKKQIKRKSHNLNESDIERMKFIINYFENGLHHKQYFEDVISYYLKNSKSSDYALSLLGHAANYNLAISLFNRKSLGKIIDMENAGEKTLLAIIETLKNNTDDSLILIDSILSKIINSPKSTDRVLKAAVELTHPKKENRYLLEYFRENVITIAKSDNAGPLTAKAIKNILDEHDYSLENKSELLRLLEITI